MENLKNQIEKTQQIITNGYLPVSKSGRLSIKDTPYEVILENQLVILESLKKISDRHIYR